GLLVDGNIARCVRPAIEIDTAHEGKIASHTVAGNEVGIADESLQDGDAYEIAIESDVAGEGVGERLTGSYALAGQRRVDKFCKDVHAGARASDGNAASDQSVQLIFDGSAFPEIDVVGLVATGNPQSLGVLNGGDHEGIAGSSAIRNDQGRNGILVRTELLDVGIVGIGAGGTNHEEIAVAAAAAHPLKCGIYIRRSEERRV